MIELNESQAAFLTLLERLPAKHMITRPTVAPAKPKSTRGRPAVVYDNRKLVAYMDGRADVVPVGELTMPEWLEDIISGSLTWRESDEDNTHKLSPSRMKRILTTLPEISTAAVMAMPTRRRIGKRAAQYYVKAAVVACELAVLHMQSDRWVPDLYDLEAGEGLDVELDWAA